MTRKEEALLKRQAKLEAEQLRISGMKEYERRHEDCLLICGIDEAGRGPFAGPVVAGAVILDWKNPDKEILYLNDSKKLSEKRRELLYKEIFEKAVAAGAGIVGAQVIDQINILQATYLAMHRAVKSLRPVSGLLEEDQDIHTLVRNFVLHVQKEDAGQVMPDFILADAVHIPDLKIPQEGIVKGDAKSVSIAAASIIAKVTRDHIMLEYDKQHPEYGFAGHKGYGTAAHIAAIKEHGMLPIHRRSFIHFV